MKDVLPSVFQMAKVKPNLKNTVCVYQLAPKKNLCIFVISATMLDLTGRKSLDFTGTVNATISIALLSLTLHRKGFTTKYKIRT